MMGVGIDLMVFRENYHHIAGQETYTFNK